MGSRPCRQQTKSNESATESWCSSQVKVKKFSFTWTIHNFSSRIEEVGECLTSSKFPDGSTEKQKWYLHLYPKGRSEESKDFVSICLILFSCDKNELRAKYKFSFINARNEEFNTYKGQDKFVRGHGWLFAKHVRRDVLLEKTNGLLPDDKLTFYCEVCVSESVNISSENTDVQFVVPECSLSVNFGQLFKSEKHSDVILSVKGQEIAAHKAILAARSKVFSAMFEHEMEEKKRNRVEIIDIDHDILREILHYIYAGKVSNIENMTVDLLYAADKYALDDLKILCEKHIYSTLSVSNAAEVLIFADMHGVGKLKDLTIDFITRHGTDVMETPGWRTMVQINSNLVSEVSRALATCLNPCFEPPQKRRKL